MVNSHLDCRFNAGLAVLVVVAQCVVAIHHAIKLHAANVCSSRVQRHSHPKLTWAALNFGTGCQGDLMPRTVGELFQGA